MNKLDVAELVKFSKTLRVLVVEDNEESRAQAIKLLSNFFSDITEAKDGKDGLQKFKDGTFDLIISDLNMPNMNGIEMVTAIREIDIIIPVIILSAYNDSEHLMETIKLDIAGYVLKPINIYQFIETLQQTIETLKLRYDVVKYKNELETLNNDLERQVKERVLEIVDLNREIEETQREVVFTMGAIGESRSKETGFHVKRVAEYSKLLALKYGLDEKDAELLKQASPMHDIGKVGIPDSILNKPAKLTNEEFDIMKTHSELGYDMLKSSTRPLLKLAAIVAHEHHEKYNGKGYPQGLKGEDININGRITALADVFDALGSDRKYKKAWIDEDIFNLLKSERGEHFDPKLIDIFFDNLDEFLAIRDTFN